MNEGKEMIPNWTGFHYEVTSKLNNDIDEVFYLPAINQSPTNLEIVQEFLYQVKSQSQAIGLHCSDLVLGQAIYSKALEILQNPNYSDLKQYINLRLGGFHVCLNFLAVIGTRLYIWSYGTFGPMVHLVLWYIWSYGTFGPMVHLVLWYWRLGFTPTIK